MTDIQVLLLSVYGQKVADNFPCTAPKAFLLLRLGWNSRAAALALCRCLPSPGHLGISGLVSLFAACWLWPSWHQPWRRPLPSARGRRCSVAGPPAISRHSLLAAPATAANSAGCWGRLRSRPQLRWRRWGWRPGCRKERLKPSDRLGVHALDPVALTGSKPGQAGSPAIQHRMQRCLKRSDALCRSC